MFNDARMQINIEHLHLHLAFANLYSYPFILSCQIQHIRNPQILGFLEFQVV